jgi:DNA-binding Xre family transcriptional regulator
MDEIPERIRKAFAGRIYLNQTELAAALEMNIKTVARHMDEGNLKYTEVGMGKVRPRRRSTLSQVCAFCNCSPPSTGSRCGWLGRGNCQSIADCCESAPAVAAAGFDN